ncbi:protein translocase subunit secY/sec61 alpha [Mariprofundus aestuarium]|uniref:Protein translocase subunit SecY n=1 Tax=Mariprofundus aestuarium TaxID=1921086 RepID=A0A2K8L3I3_MARES|nr:preprotein translocase subunit SecY [Mariprofundus aestuarium]ATX78806.1 protein translocase subunit secY/sec61 alpha [Mariprofundus aestuarium]
MAQPGAMGGFGDIGKIPELKSRILFTLGMLIVYRIGAHIPVPGIDAGVLAQFFSQAQGSLLGMFDMFSGGALSRLTIFALGIMPYISASIIIQLMTVVSPKLEQLKKEGEAGRRKITEYTRYFTLVLATFQAIGISIGLEQFSVGGQGVVIDPGLPFRAMTVITLVTGTMFLMWLGEQITERGIGNGISLIIFAGIAAGLPSAIGGTLELARTGEFTAFTVLALFAMTLAVTGLVVWFERAQRRIPIQYAKRQVGNRIYGGKSSFLPLKVNTAGVIPPIFASSLILLPATFAQFTKGAEGFEWLGDISAILSPGAWLYMALFTGLIVFFCFFYTAIVFNPKDTADNLKKNGGFIPGIRPGQKTAEYVDSVLTRITVVGAAYVSMVCLLPEWLIANLSVPFYFGGTSLLIVVVVTMDTMGQIQSHLMSHQYEGLMKKARLKTGK